MNTSMSRALALLLLIVPFCRGDVLHYTVNFGTSSGGVTPTGTFTYNTATNLFETFDVTILGYSIDFASAANAPIIVPPAGPSCPSGLTGAPAFFQALQQPCPYGSWQLERAGTTGNFYLIFSKSAVAEPQIGAATSFALASSEASSIIFGSPVTATEQSPTVPEPTFALPLGLAIGALAWRRARPSFPVRRQK